MELLHPRKAVLQGLQECKAVSRSQVWLKHAPSSRRRRKTPPQTMDPSLGPVPDPEVQSTPPAPGERREYHSTQESSDAQNSHHLCPQGFLHPSVQGGVGRAGGPAHPWSRLGRAVADTAAFLLPLTGVCIPAGWPPPPTPPPGSPAQECEERGAAGLPPTPPAPHGPPPAHSAPQVVAPSFPAATSHELLP